MMISQCYRINVLMCVIVCYNVINRCPDQIGVRWCSDGVGVVLMWLVGVVGVRCPDPLVFVGGINPSVRYRSCVQSCSWTCNCGNGVITINPLVWIQIIRWCWSSWMSIVNNVISSRRQSIGQSMSSVSILMYQFCMRCSQPFLYCASGVRWCRQWCNNRQ